jgi:hypothetical protein
MAAVAKEISKALHDLMLEGIVCEKVAGQSWEQSRLEQAGSRLLAAAMRTAIPKHCAFC